MPRIAKIEKIRYSIGRTCVCNVKREFKIRARLDADFHVIPPEHVQSLHLGRQTPKRTRGGHFDAEYTLAHYHGIPCQGEFPKYANPATKRGMMSRCESVCQAGDRLSGRSLQGKAIIMASSRRNLTHAAHVVHEQRKDRRCRDGSVQQLRTW